MSYITPAVVINANNILSLQTIRALGRKGIPVHAISLHDDKISLYEKIIQKSKYVTKFFIYKKNNQEYEKKLITALLVYARLLNAKAVLFPVSDQDMINVSKNRNSLNEFYYLVMPEHNILEELLYKERFSKLAQNFDLTVPNTIVIENEEDIYKKIKMWNLFPCIVKPSLKDKYWVKSYGNKKAIIIKSKTELENMAKFALGSSQKIIIQEIIGGRESNIFCSFCFLDDRNQADLIFICKKIRQYPLYFGNTAIAESVINLELENITRDICKRLKLVGYVSIEFKRNFYHHKYYILEITASRMNRQAGLSEISGLNLPFLWYNYAINPNIKIDFPRSYKNGIKWISELNEIRCFLNYLRKKDFSLFDIFKSYRGVRGFELFAVDDLKPLIQAIASMMKIK